MKDTLFCGCDRDAVMSCMGLNERKYAKGETIARMSDNINRIGILECGKAHISCIDSEGNINIAEHLACGSVFGELFTMSDESLEFIVEADSACSVKYIDYEKVLRPCENNCANHCALLNNLFHMAATKSRKLSLHINILSRKTTRQKLLTYFETLPKSEDGYMEIPIPFAGLAEYICSDRSAMMREIKNMKADGIIETQGRKIRICGQTA